MSSRRALAENLIFSALSAASNGLAFLLLIVAAHFLTTDEMGVLGTAFAFAAIGEPLMDFGLHQVSIRHIARDRASARDILGASIPMKAASGLVMWLGLSGIALAWYTEAATASILMLGSAIIRSYLLTIRGVLQGLEHFRHDAVVMFADRAFMLVGGVVALWLGGGVSGLAVSFIVTRILALMIALILATRHVRAVALNFDTAFWRELRDHAVPVGAFLMVLSAYNYIDQLLLARWSGTWDEGVYANVYRIYEALTYGSGVLSAVLTPRLSALWQDNRQAHQRLARFGVFGAALAGALIGAIAWVAAPWIVHLAYPMPAYQEGVRALRVLCSGLGLVFAIWILHTMAMSMYDARLLLRSTLVGLFANIAFNVWLIPHWHRDGAAVATVAGEAVVLVLLVWGLRRVLFGAPATTPGTT